MAEARGKTYTEAGEDDGEWGDKSSHQQIDITEGTGGKSGEMPAVEYVSDRAGKGGDDDQCAGVAYGEMNRQLQDDDHEGNGDDTTADAEKGRKSTAGKTDQQKQPVRHAVGALRGQMRMKQKELETDSYLHHSEQTLEPDPGEDRGERTAGEGTDDPADREPDDMLPDDITPFAVPQGAAERRRNNDRQASTEGGMNDDLRGEAGQREGPEEKGNEDDAAADAEQSGKQSGKGTQQQKKNEDLCRQQGHAFR